jgi:FkbM family methyltransferase
MQLELRECGIEEVDTLWWIKGDTGAWDGPLQDWIEGRDSFLHHVPTDGTVLQAGGCCGMYPRFYRQNVGRVITFEPNKDNYACLMKNCASTDIEHHNAALGSDIGTAMMKYSTAGGHNLNIGMHRIDASVAGDVYVTTIDSLRLESLDLIHLDLEGSEEDAIVGGMQTITRFWPTIITERNNGSDILELLGYKCVKTFARDSIYVKEWW